MKEEKKSIATRMGVCETCLRYSMLVEGMCRYCDRGYANKRYVSFRRRTNGEVGDILGFKAGRDGLIPLRQNDRILSVSDWIAITEGVASFYENITPAEIKEYNKRVAIITDESALPSKPDAIIGYVYLLRSENGFYKIGRATSVDMRLSTIQRSFPIEIKLVHCFRSQDYVAAEKYLHLRYHEYRPDRTEWFALPDWAIEYIQDLKDYDLDPCLPKNSPASQEQHELP